MPNKIIAYKMKSEAFESVFNYLISRPYKEVGQLIDLFKNRELFVPVFEPSAPVELTKSELKAVDNKE